jgi:hypothetical protein
MGQGVTPAERFSNEPALAWYGMDWVKEYQLR